MDDLTGSRRGHGMRRTIRLRTALIAFALLTVAMGVVANLYRRGTLLPAFQSHHGALYQDCIENIGRERSHIASIREHLVAGHTCNIPGCSTPAARHRYQRQLAEAIGRLREYERMADWHRLLAGPNQKYEHVIL